MATKPLTSSTGLLRKVSLPQGVVAFGVSAVRRAACHTACSKPVTACTHGLDKRHQPSRAAVVVRATGDGNEPDVKYSSEFGYSRKDVFIICGGLIALGYALYYGLQALGVDAGIAGNWVQLIIFFGICVGWVSTYIFRVATKQMTYVKQLEAYEDAVIKKRIEEMTETEMTELAEEVEAEKQRKAQRRAQQQQQQ